MLLVQQGMTAVQLPDGGVRGIGDIESHRSLPVRLKAGCECIAHIVSDLQELDVERWLDTIFSCGALLFPLQHDFSLTSATKKHSSLPSRILGCLVACFSDCDVPADLCELCRLVSVHVGEWPCIPTGGLMMIAHLVSTMVVGERVQCPSPSTVHLFVVMFALMGFTVNFVDVKIREVI